MKLCSSNGRICGRHNENRSMLTLNGGKGTLDNRRFTSKGTA